jgi:hypothetical protein
MSTAFCLIFIVVIIIIGGKGINFINTSKYMARKFTFFFLPMTAQALWEIAAFAAMTAFVANHGRVFVIQNRMWTKYFSPLRDGGGVFVSQNQITAV